MSKFNDEVVSKEVLETLTKDLNFNLPDVNLDNISLDDINVEIPTELLNELKQAPTQINIDTLTKPEIGGDATFDRLMYAVKIHLKEEVDKGRITGSEYANAYVTMAGNAMQSAVQYELNRYQTNYQAILSHINAITAIIEAKCKLASSKVELATAKVMYASSVAQANNHRATYADTVMNLGIKDANYGLVNAQKDSVDATVIREDSVSAQQIKLIASQKDSTDAAVVRENSLSAQQIKLMESQKNSTDAAIIRDNNVSEQQIKLMGSQKASTDASVVRDDRVADENIKVSEKQIEQMGQNIEASKASVIRDDSVSAQQISLMGSQKASIDASVIRDDSVSAQQIRLMGSQKDSIDAAVIRENNLTDQQIKSYIIKDKRECAKIYSDSYITNLSVDAGMKVPDSMTDTNISSVMNSLRQASGL